MLTAALVIGGTIAIALVCGLLPVKREHDGSPTSISPGYGPEYNDDLTVMRKYVPRKCWRRIQEIRAYQVQYNVSLSEAVAVVRAKYEQPEPRMPQSEPSIEWAQSEQTARDWARESTQRLDGITEHVDAYGYNAPGWPVKQGQEARR
jgi:hypothetical protein